MSRARPERAPDPVVDFDELWSALPQPAAIFGPDDAFVAANGAAELFLSMSAATLVGRRLADFIGPNSRLADVMRQARRDGFSLAEHGVEFLWPERPPQLVDLHAAPMHERAGHILLLIQPRSIAEKMDRSLTHRSAARAATGMSAMLAHEIKNPLAGISGAAQLLETSVGDGDRELTTLIREEAERIRALIDRVDQFGDTRPPVRAPVNIHDVLDQARRAAAAGFGAHVRFIEEYDPSLPLTAGDRDQLMQAILNLVKNAAEAAPRVGGVVTLRTAYRAGVRIAAPGGGRESLPLQVTVADNGPGVPAELIGDIFDPFVTSKARGDGLGLAMVAKVLADHGGVVECESEPGATRFRLLLPVWREGVAAAAPVREETA